MAGESLKFLYSADDFIFESPWTAERSKFDKVLQSHWNEAKKKGYFRFNLDQMLSRVLPGAYGFVADLNLGRGTLRRRPQEMMSLSQPFNSEKFNFTKVDKREVIMELCNGRRETGVGGKHVIMINVSPIQQCSVLLVPNVNGGLPQVLTLQSLEVAMEMTLLSACRSLLVGWNSLCGNASVNHLHFHAYYLEHQLRLQTEPTTKLAGPCHLITTWPVPCFVFQLENGEVHTLSRNVHRVVDYLHKSEIAHNICLTRGAKLGEDIPESSSNTLRAFIWPRCSVFGIKEAEAFNIAFSELVGHIPVMNRELFDELTDESAAAALQEASLPPEQFQAVVRDVQSSFNEVLL